MVYVIDVVAFALAFATALAAAYWLSGSRAETFTLTDRRTLVTSAVAFGVVIAAAIGGVIDWSALIGAMCIAAGATIGVGLASARRRSRT